MRFIMSRMSSNCLSSLFTSCTEDPEPLEMRFLRYALMISGLRRSPIVMLEMIAA